MRTRIVYPAVGEKWRGNRYYIDDKQVAEAEYRATCKPFDMSELSAPPAAEANWKQPIASEAIACHPDQIPEMRASLEAAGVKAEIDSHGRVIMTSRAHKREICKAMGMFDRDGGYGDAQRGSYRGSYE